VNIGQNPTTTAKESISKHGQFKGIETQGKETIPKPFRNIYHFG